MEPSTSTSSLYRNIYFWFDGFLPESLDWLAYSLTGLVIAVVIINVFLVLVALYTWFERRALARFQVRIGPNRWGPFGLLQPVADLVKLLTKEDIVPVGADRWVFNLAPIVMFIPGVLVLAVIPFGKNSFIADLNVGILFIIAVTSVNTLGVFMAGWASGNKYALFGAMRGVAQLISYEVPMALSIVGILLLTGSLSLIDIVDNQRIPFLLVQPLGFLVFLMAASAEMSRTPFDVVEAESELVAGHTTEYSGMKFGLIFLAEFAAPILNGAIVATIFLQGWRGPVLPSHLWFFLKTFIVVFLFLWIRATFPRLRIDQILSLAWKGLLPLALVNLFITAVEVQIWPSPSIGQLWVMVAINWAIMLISVALAAMVLGQERLRRVKALPSPLAFSIKEGE